MTITQLLYLLAGFMLSSALHRARRPRGADIKLALKRGQP